MWYLQWPVTEQWWSCGKTTSQIACPCVCVQCHVLLSCIASSGQIGLEWNHPQMNMNPSNLGIEWPATQACFLWFHFVWACPQKNMILHMQKFHETVVQLHWSMWHHWWKEDWMKTFWTCVWREQLNDFNGTGKLQSSQKMMVQTQKCQIQCMCINVMAFGVWITALTSWITAMWSNWTVIMTKTQWFYSKQQIVISVVDPQTQQAGQVWLCDEEINWQEEVWRMRYLFFARNVIPFVGEIDPHKLQRWIEVSCCHPHASLRRQGCVNL